MAAGAGIAGVAELATTAGAAFSLLAGCLGVCDIGVSCQAAPSPWVSLAPAVHW